MIEPDELERRLEHLGERIAPRGDTLQRLERRFVRRRSMRKVGTVALALFIALVGFSAASIAFVGGDGSGSETLGASAWAPPDMPTLWPENWTDLGAAASEADAQQRADAGDPAFSWRTDPVAVVRRFLVRQLGWEAVGAVHVASLDAPPSASGRLRFAVSCGRRCPAGPATVFLIQPQRPGAGGIWSVTGVVDPHVRIAIGDTRAGTGDAVTATAGESSARVSLSMGEGFAGRGGFVSTDGCTWSESSSQPMVYAGGHWDTEILSGSVAAARSGACGATASAYLFGYVKSGEGGAGSGKLFDEPHVILYHFTAIPLLVTMPQASQTTSAEAGRSERAGSFGLPVVVVALVLSLLALALVRVRRRSR